MKSAGHGTPARSEGAQDLSPAASHSAYGPSPDARTPSSETSSELPCSQGGTCRPGRRKPVVLSGLARAGGLPSAMREDDVVMCLQQACLCHQFYRLAAVEAGGINLGCVQRFERHQLGIGLRAQAHGVFK